MSAFPRKIHVEHNGLLSYCCLLAARSLRDCCGIVCFGIAVRLLGACCVVLTCWECEQACGHSHVCKSDTHRRFLENVV